MTANAAARSIMTMRAVVQRNSTTSTNAWGLADAPSYGTHKTIPCRIWSSGRRALVDGDKTVAVEDLRAMFPLDADVSEDDRIEKVTDRQGKTIWAGPISIRVLQHKHQHLEALLDREGS